MTSIASATFTITPLGTFLIAILLSMNMIAILLLFLIIPFRSIMVVIMLMEWIAVLMDQGVEFRGLVKRF